MTPRDHRPLIVRYRSIFVAALHVVLSAVSFYAAFALKLDTLKPWENELYGQVFLPALPLLLVVRFGCFLAYDLYRGMWRYVSITDLTNILRSVTVGTMLFVPIAIV